MRRSFSLKANTAFVALTLGLTLIVVRPAAAYVFEGVTWAQPTLDMKLELPPPSEILIDGSLDYAKSFENAMLLWNQQLANFKLTWTEMPGGTPAYDNGQTEVSMQPSVYGNNFGSEALAVTFLNYSNGQFREADVVFNVNQFKFNSYRGFAGSNQDFHRIALHELGHVLGLDHPDQNHPNVGYTRPSQPPDAVMLSSVSGLDRLQTDDIHGAQALYGAAADAPSASDGGGRLANISTRVRVGSDESVMIGGFIIQDSTKPVLIRALGPSLTPFGVNNALGDPTLELHDSTGKVIAFNNNWKDDPAQAQAIAATGIAPTNDLESAIYANLAPGAYTAVVAGANGDTGVGLVEVYDQAVANGKVGNISTRGQVGVDQEVLIGGFIVTGPQSVRVIVRAIGPSLSGYFADYLRDPMLELRNGNGDLLQQNDDWDKTNNAFAYYNLDPKNTAESALLANLVPGNYTAIVRGKNNTSGVGLVEIYKVSTDSGS